MATKKHKAKKSTITNVPPPYILRQQWPWPELPPTNPSDHPAARNLWRTNLSSALAITKAWLPPPSTTRCDAHHNQPPQLRHVEATPTENPSYPSPPEPRYHYLHDSATIVEAAAKMPNAIHCRSLSYSPTARARTRNTNPTGPIPHLNFIIGLNGPTSGLTVVYGDTNVSVWHECNTPDPFDAQTKTKKNKKMEFTSVVRLEGKHYAMSLQGAVAVMEEVDTRLTITALGATRAVPSWGCRFFKEYLFEMDGEVLLVFLIHFESIEVVDRVDVFRLDLVRLDWVKVERLQGKTVFLKERCVWVDSEEFGCGDDRVFFVEGSEERWKVFDMKSCCISSVSYGWSW